MRPEWLRRFFRRFWVKEAWRDMPVATVSMDQMIQWADKVDLGQHFHTYGVFLLFLSQGRWCLVSRKMGRKNGIMVYPKTEELPHIIQFMLVHNLPVLYSEQEGIKFLSRHGYRLS